MKRSSSSSLSSSSSSTSSTTMSLPFVAAMGENPPTIKLKVQSQGNDDDGTAMFVNIHALQILNEQHELSYDKIVDLATKYARDSKDGSRLTYVDEEGDVVAILSNEGLAMAMEGPSTGRRYVRMSLTATDQQQHVDGGEEEGKKDPAAVCDEPKQHSEAVVAATGDVINETANSSGNDKRESGSILENDGISHVNDVDTVEWKQCGMDLPCQAPSNYSLECVSLSSDGSIMVVGSPYSNSNGTDSGLVRVYERHEDEWSQLGDDIPGSGENNRCGWSTSLSSNGRVLAVGLPWKDKRRGCVRMYELMNCQWMQKGDDIVGKADGNWCGRSVSLSSDGTVVAIGSPYSKNDSGSWSGHVRVYEHGTSGWSQRGSTIVGNGVYDRCGYSVSLSSDGNMLAIGSPWNSDNGSYSGHVRIFKYSTGIWSQEGSTIVGKAGDECGFSVSLLSDGNVVAIGSPFFDGDGDDGSTGLVRVFEHTAAAGGWVQRGDDIVGKCLHSRCGWSVSLSSDGKVLVVGSPFSSLNGQPCFGLVEAFRLVSGGWTKIGSDITGKADGDFCGMIASISSDGKSLAVGSSGNESNGHVKSYTL